MIGFGMVLFKLAFRLCRFDLQLALFDADIGMIFFKTLLRRNLVAVSGFNFNDLFVPFGSKSSFNFLPD